MVVEYSNCEWLHQAWFEVSNGSISNPSKLKKLANTDFLEDFMGSLIKKRRKKMSKHKYRKRLKANRHKKK